MLEAFPRLHPVLLHLPIGVLIALVWLRLWGRFVSGSSGAARSNPDGGVNADRGARRPLVCLLALSTFLAALTGWLLHESASYPEPVEWHEYLGVALLVVTLVMVWAEFKKPKLYEPLLWIAFVLLIPTGHLGGTLTHGEDFLFGPSEAESGEGASGEAGPAKVVPLETTYEGARPILEQYCMHCHGERKQRGGLAMHTEAALLAGGDSGPVWVPGDQEKSRIVQVLNAPLDHDDHMPPANKSQLSAAELARLNKWLTGPPE